MADLVHPQDKGQRLQALQKRVLQDRALIIVANRGPVTFEALEDGTLAFQRGPGGLVTALLGLCQHTRATWIGCAQNAADVAWGGGELLLAQNESEIRVNVQFISPSEAAYDGYYNTISNPLLWFLQHSMWDIPRAPVINRRTWRAWEEGYVAVNRMFAHAIAEQVRSTVGRTLVMLQDYHLYLTPRLLRAQLPRGERPVTLHFVHIPWPGPEYWGILPPTMRQTVLDGLCGVDLLGFQTREDGRNFLRTCEVHVPRARVNFRYGRIWYRNHATHVRDFPISIDVEAVKQLAESSAVAQHNADLRQMLNPDQLVVRVDRIEPSKNIVRGFLAFEEMLEMYPEHRGRVQFLAILVPSRREVVEYQNYLDEIMAAVGRVNAAHGNSEWEPIRVLIGEDYERALAALQLYDVLLVNAIADGMNLVAKEGPIVNQRNGVLILSELAGSSQQLAPGATVVSPCDVYATAQALHQGLTMSETERRNRSGLLRWMIEREDIIDWLCRQLEAIVELQLA